MAIDAGLIIECINGYCDFNYFIHTWKNGKFAYVLDDPIRKTLAME